MRKIVSTDKAPAAIGPYSQANIFGDFVFISGQVPLDPATGDIVGTTIEEQTRQVFKNMKAILETAGSSLAEFFTEGSYPSRSAVEVARLPKDVLVEIETIAYR